MDEIWTDVAPTEQAAPVVTQGAEVWETVPSPNTVMFDESRNQAISVPTGLTEEEIRYQISTQIDKAPKKDFFGMLKYGTDVAAEAPKALYNFTTTTLPRTVGDSLIEFGEVAQQRQAKYFPSLAYSESGMHSRTIAAGRKLVALANTIAEESNTQRPEGDPAKQVSYDIGNAVGSVVASVGALVVTKNPASVVALFTSIFNAQKYNEMRSKGFNPDTASAASLIAALPQGALEGVGSVVMVGALGASKVFLRIAARAAEEPIEEGLQTASEITTDALFHVKQTTREEAVKQIGYSMFLGLVGGAPVAGVFTAVEHIAGKSNVTTLDRAELNQVLSIANDRGVQAMLEADGLSRQAADSVVEQVALRLANDGAIEEMANIIERELSPMAHDNIDIPGVEKLGDLGTGEFKPFTPTEEKTFSQKLSEIVNDSTLADKAEATVMATALEGRMNILDAESESVSKEMTALSEERWARIAEGKPTKQIDAKLRKLQRQFDSIDVQRGDILTTAAQEMNVQNEDIKIKGAQLSKAALDNRIAGFKAGAKTGRKLTLDEVKKVQRDLVNYLRKETRLSPKDRADFITNILGNTTEEQFARNVSAIEQKVSAIEEKADVKVLRSRIEKLLSQIDPAGGNAPHGKYTPEIQKILTRIREISKLSIKDGVKLIADTQLQANDLATPEQALDNRIIDMFAGFKGRDSVQLKEALDELEALVNTGRAISLLKQMSRIEQKNRAIEMALADITGPVVDETPVKIPKNQYERNIQKMKHFYKSFGKSMSLNWKQLTDTFSQDSDSKAGESFLTKATDIRPNVAKWIGQRESYLKSFLADYVMPNTDIKTVKQFTDYLKTLHDTISLGTFRDANLKLRDMTYTRDQIIGFWAHFQDPTIKDSFSAEEGNAFTPAMIKELNDFVESNEKDLGFAKATLEFYRSFHEYINSSFSDRNGVDLPFNPMYSPVRRVHNSDVENANPFATEFSTEGSLLPKSLLSRVGSKREIKLNGAYATLAQHVSDMTFYVEASEKIQLTESIFRDPRVKEAITQKFGPEAYQIAMDKIKYFKRRGVVARDMVVPWLDAIRRARTLGMLYKPYQYVKQMTGVFSYLSDVNSVEMVSAIADLAKGGKAKLNQLYELSPVLQSRMGNLSVDIDDAMRSKEAATFLEHPTWVNFMLFFSRHGALHADMIGGYAVYKKALKANGGDTQAAIAKMEDVMLDVQPSSLMTEQTDWQQKGSLYRLMSMFMSAQNKYFQMEQHAIRNAIKGRMSVKDAARIVFIYHILLPSLFQFVSDYGKWKWAEQMRAMALGSFNGIFLAGNYIETAVRMMLHYGFRQEDVATFEHNKQDLFIMGADELTKAIKALDHNTIMAEDVFAALGHLMSGATQTAGLPTKFVTDNIPNIIESIQQGDIMRAIKAASGATQYQLDEDK